MPSNSTSILEISRFNFGETDWTTKTRTNAQIGQKQIHLMPAICITYHRNEKCLPIYGIWVTEELNVFEH